jgi:hypothetical protein
MARLIFKGLREYFKFKILLNLAALCELIIIVIFNKLLLMSGIRDPLGGLNKPVVSYFYDEDLGNFQYGVGHPMKPFRVKMTDELIKAYGMEEKMKRMHVEQDFIDNVDFTVFHSDDYVDVLKNLVPEDRDKYAD